MEFLIGLLIGLVVSAIWILLYERKVYFLSYAKERARLEKSVKIGEFFSDGCICYDRIVESPQNPRYQTLKKGLNYRRCTNTIYISKGNHCIEMYNAFDDGGYGLYGQGDIDPYPIFIRADEDNSSHLVEMSLFFLKYAYDIDPSLNDSCANQETLEEISDITSSLLIHSL